jgi:beta-glucosidase
MQTLQKQIPTPWISESTEARVAQMTLLEKIGQMTQVEKNSLKPGDVKRLALGSVLSGGGGNPTPNNPQTWRSMVEAFQEEALDSRLGIPLLYGSDGVHGHNNVVGATIFPHNIGLGCTRDADLIKRIARVTALECVATGVRWDFAPAVSIPRDIRWGRSYEGYSQDAKLVSELATAYVEGLKGEAWDSPTAVLPSVKHFIADGATNWGTSTRSDRVNLETDRTLAIAKMGEDFVALLDRGAWQLDQGASTLPESILRKEDLAGYAATIAAGALNVMVSYSSWMGTRMHEHKYLLTDVLKGELGFQGFLVSDWEAVQQLPNDFAGNVVSSINAGLDMIMVPFDYQAFMSTLEQAVTNGDVPLERIDDAVSRILHAKEVLGLFQNPRTDAKLLEKVGCLEHRAVAREAVQKSLVLLKNNGVLPLSRDTRLLVAGKAAHDVGLQCGGWSITWMGEAGPTTPGTTILEGLQSLAAENTVIYDLEGTGEEHFEVGLVVLSEATYAEGMGDRISLDLNAEQKTLLERVRARCEKMVVVLISGRPLIVTNDIANWDAFVAAWLPGTEGAGVSDVLYGEQPFTGKLGFHWAESHDDIPLTTSSKALFELGFGLTTDGDWY